MFVRLGHLINPVIIVRHWLINVRQIPIKSMQRFSKQTTETIFGILKYTRQVLIHILSSLGNHYTELLQNSPDLIDQCRSLTNNQTTHAMNRQHILLLCIFDGNQSHVGTLYSLTNRFSINSIVLVRLNKWAPLKTHLSMAFLNQRELGRQKSGNMLHFR